MVASRLRCGTPMLVCSFKRNQLPIAVQPPLRTMAFPSALKYHGLRAEKTCSNDPTVVFHTVETGRRKAHPDEVRYISLQYFSHIATYATGPEVGYPGAQAEHGPELLEKPCHQGRLPQGNYSRHGLSTQSTPCDSGESKLGHIKRIYRYAVL